MIYVVLLKRLSSEIIVGGGMCVFILDLKCFFFYDGKHDTSSCLFSWKK